MRDAAGEIGLAARDDIMVAGISHAGGEHHRRRQIELVRDRGDEVGRGFEERRLVLEAQDNYYSLGRYVGVASCTPFGTSICEQLAIVFLDRLRSVVAEYP